MTQTPGSFQSQQDVLQMRRDSLVSRLYGQYNQRGPYLYPRSPNALGDIVPMSAMVPVDEATLFTQLPTAGELATSTAPIGSVGYPTFLASNPTTPGTVLGPAGTTVPIVSGATAQIANSYTSPYGDPAATLEQAAVTGQPTGPITYTSPFPSIVQPPQQTQPAQPSGWCEFGKWVNDNPGLALLGTWGLYLFLRGKKR